MGLRGMRSFMPRLTQGKQGSKIRVSIGIRWQLISVQISCGGFQTKRAKVILKI